MGYDLKPRNKNIDWVTFGAFAWPEMLRETGMGYVLGYGRGIDPGTYVYNTGNNGSPSSNDGYKVSSSEAKAMAMVARGYVSVHRFINKLYEDMSAEKREICEANKAVYTQPIGEYFLNKLEEFADFAEKSGGFIIY